MLSYLRFVAVDGTRIREIYSSKVARRYDFSMPPFFLRWKRLAIEGAELEPGATVLVFCCGTGLDFSFIVDSIGPQGEVVGVDFSPVMLGAAAARVEEHQWSQVRLVEADVTTFEDSGTGLFDAGVCTLGMSVIPDYEAAYDRLLAHVKPGGTIVVGDMQLASGWRACFNPLTIGLSRKFGGTKEGHRNSAKLRSMMEAELLSCRSREFFLGAYFFCAGTKPPAS